jgi:peptidoglycan hydrolase CwlO-like protein
MSIVGLIGVSIYFYQRLEKLDKTLSTACKDITVLAESLKDIQRNNSDYIIDQISRLRNILMDHKRDIDKLKSEINKVNESIVITPTEQTDDVIRSIVEEVNGKDMVLSTPL